VLLAAVGLAIALGNGDDRPADAPPLTTQSVETAELTAPAPQTTPPPQTALETESGVAGGTAGTTTPQEPPYALAATRSCLLAGGAAVSPIRSTDPRLRALGDLAQRASLEVRLGGQTLGVAFGDAGLLESLLLVPDDPYVLEVRRNALLMYRPGAKGSAAVLRGCLRS
jgi:hypothetical protein